MCSNKYYCLLKKINKYIYIVLHSKKKKKTIYCTWKGPKRLVVQVIHSQKPKMIKFRTANPSLTIGPTYRMIPKTIGFVPSLSFFLFYFLFFIFFSWNLIWEIGLVFKGFFVDFRFYHWRQRNQIHRSATQLQISMGKNEFLTPKAIANQIIAKGLQKLWWYCQMCQKQCRNENGFKCHCMSESHQRQMEVFSQNLT